MLFIMCSVDFVDSSLRSIPALLCIFHDSRRTGVYLLVESMENPGHSSCLIDAVGPRLKQSVTTINQKTWGHRIGSIWTFWPCKMSPSFLKAHWRDSKLWTLFLSKPFTQVFCHLYFCNSLIPGSFGELQFPFPSAKLLSRCSRVWLCATP